MSEQEMSHEDAVAAIETAVSQDATTDQADPFVQPSAPPTTGEPQTQVQPPAAQPAEPTPVEPAAEPVADTFDGQFNPDTLPAELQPGWKQLQAAFTQKTQEIAAERQQLEALGDLESLQQAAELYNRISDPNNWEQLHSELTQAMVEYGYSPAEAAQAAGEQMEEAAALPDLSSMQDDPELAPLLQHMQAQQDRLDQFEQQQLYTQQQAEAERTHDMLVGELTRQANAIRQARPEYTDSDMDAIYQLSSFHNGNLISAQHAYEEHVGRRISQYFEKKQGAAQEPAVQPQPGAGITSAQDAEPETLEEAEAWAIEHMRGLAAQGEDLSF